MNNRRGRPKSGRREHLPTQWFRVLVDAVPGPRRKASEGIDRNRE